MATSVSASPIRKLEKDHLVSPIRTPRRVDSLQSFHARPSHPFDLPKDGYLGLWTVERVVSFLISILFAGFQLQVIICALSAVLLDRKPVTHRGHAVQVHLEYICAAVPFVFAAIAGRFFRALALYRSQKSVTLGSLERFIGSTSLFTAIERQLRLWPLSWTGLFTILFWFLSQFASHAALRILSIEVVAFDKQATTKYLSIIHAAQNNLQAASNRSMPLLRRLLSYGIFFNIALLTQWTAHLPTDYKGYVKIPSAHSLISAAESYHTGWREVDYSKPVLYSSFHGIPVSGLHDGVNTTFELASRHWSVDCFSLERTSMSYEDVQAARTWTGPYQIDLALPTNETRHQSAWPIRFRSLRGDSVTEGFTSQMMGKPDEGNSYPPLPINEINCSIGAQDVVSNVSCVGTACEVNAMYLLNEVLHTPKPAEYPAYPNHPDDREYASSLGSKDVWNPAFWDDDGHDDYPYPSDPLTQLAVAGTPVMGLRMALNTLPLAATMTEEHFNQLEQARNITPVYARYLHGVGATAPELWLAAGTLDGYMSAQHLLPWPDYLGVRAAELAPRLEALVNTWWQSFFMPAYLAGDDLLAAAAAAAAPRFDDQDRLLLAPTGRPSVPWNVSAATATAFAEPVYACSWPCALVLAAAASLLLVAAGLTVVLDGLTVAPDVFGFASGATRDNAYMPDYAGGSHMGGFSARKGAEGGEGEGGRGSYRAHDGSGRADELEEGEEV